jgi:hypothetical protein
MRGGSSMNLAPMYISPTRVEDHSRRHVFTNSCLKLLIESTQKLLVPKFGASFDVSHKY